MVLVLPCGITVNSITQYQVLEHITEISCGPAISVKSVLVWLFEVHVAVLLTPSFLVSYFQTFFSNHEIRLLFSLLAAQGRIPAAIFWLDILLLPFSHRDT